jgi:two-component system, NarL family, sensor histidine kinase LiaS
VQNLIHTRDELARLEERNRLARDLHDTVKQQTYAARMQLTAAKNLLESIPKPLPSTSNPRCCSTVRPSRNSNSSSMSCARRASGQGTGAGHAGIRQPLAGAHRHQSGDFVSGERSLPLDVEQALYRVLQEALSNIARHSEADRVGLSLEPDSRNERLSSWLTTVAASMDSVSPPPSV